MLKKNKKLQWPLKVPIPRGVAVVFTSNRTGLIYIMYKIVIRLGVPEYKEAAAREISAALYVVRHYTISLFRFYLVIH